MKLVSRHRGHKPILQAEHTAYHPCGITGFRSEPAFPLWIYKGKCHISHLRQIHTPPLMVCFTLASRALRRPFAPVQSISNNMSVFINTSHTPLSRLSQSTLLRSWVASHSLRERFTDHSLRFRVSTTIRRCSSTPPRVNTS